MMRRQLVVAARLAVPRVAPLRPLRPQFQPLRPVSARFYSPPTSAEAEAAKAAFKRLHKPEHGPRLTGDELAEACRSVGLPKEMGELLLRRCAHHPSEGATEEEFVMFFGHFAQLWTQQAGKQLDSQREHALVTELIFKTFDTNNTECLDREELISLMEVLYGKELQEAGAAGSRIKTREAAALVFDKYDVDHDSRLKVKDLQALLDAQHESVTKAAGGKPSFGLVVKATAYTVLETVLQGFTASLTSDPSRMET